MNDKKIKQQLEKSLQALERIEALTMRVQQVQETDLYDLEQRISKLEQRLYGSVH